jgi:hypothetical protein
MRGGISSVELRLRPPFDGSGASGAGAAPGGAARWCGDNVSRRARRSRCTALARLHSTFGSGDPVVVRADTVPGWVLVCLPYTAIAACLVCPSLQSDCGWLPCLLRERDVAHLLSGRAPYPLSAPVAGVGVRLFANPMSSRARTRAQRPLRRASDEAKGGRTGTQHAALPASGPTRRRRKVPGAARGTNHSMEPGQSRPQPPAGAGVG